VDFPSSFCALSALLSLPPFLSPTLPFRNQIYSTGRSAPRDGIGRSATTGAHRAARIHRCGLLGPLTVRFGRGGIIQHVHAHATSVADVWDPRDEGFVGLRSHWAGVARRGDGGVAVGRGAIFEFSTMTRGSRVNTVRLSVVADFLFAGRDTLKLD
jgi:hypothetical protein